MAFKLNGTGTNVTKMYLFQLFNGGPVNFFGYVTTDTPATVANAGYIDTADGADSQIAFDMLKTGDMVYVYQTTALDDTQPVEDDIGDGLTDFSQHIVLAKSATQIHLSDDLVDKQVTGLST